jgi:RNase P/RNase MRP subunit p29
MRWPAIFFKSRKSRPLPEIATVPAKPAGPAEPAKVVAPARTETAKVGAAMSEYDKTESLRALTELDREDASPAADPAATKPSNGHSTSESDSGNAKTTPLPPVNRPHTLSLRQRAKLTEDAHTLPKKEERPSSPDVFAPKPEDEPPKATDPAKLAESAPETARATEEAGKVADSPKAAEPVSASDPVPGAVVPPAFPVSVDAGTVLESSAEKKAGQLSDVPPGAAKDAPSSNTARVHLDHATTSSPAPSTAIEPRKAPGDSREKKEFILANGERILGHVLSETPQTIYLDHGTLGVLTLPRSQIAAKPIEVILINGDRIVGDLIAETPECLYIKHASLGMVTVPHSQRSSRVVEAILKDGDRILGEVLAETDNFTVIRSATLGTVAVQHEQVAMLNRKIEQMQLRALPGAAPALEDKKS